MIIGIITYVCILNHWEVGRDALQLAMHVAHALCNVATTQTSGLCFTLLQEGCVLEQKTVPVALHILISDKELRLQRGLLGDGVRLLVVGSRPIQSRLQVCKI